MKFRRWMESLLQSMGMRRSDSRPDHSDGDIPDVDQVTALPSSHESGLFIHQEILACWQRFEWAEMRRLAAIHPEAVRTNPVSSALLALACLQADDEMSSRAWLRLCLDAGADPAWLTRLLLGGAEASLARACALMGKTDWAAEHDQSAEKLQHACLQGQDGAGMRARLIFGRGGLPGSAVANEVSP